MAKKVDPSTYARMRPKETFIVLEAAYARQDMAEANRIIEAIPRINLRAIDPIIPRLNLAATQLASWVMFDLQRILCAYGKYTLAAGMLRAYWEHIPASEGTQDMCEEEREFRNAQTELDRMQLAYAQEASAVLEAIRTVCEQDIGLTVDELIGSCAPHAVGELAKAQSVGNVATEPETVTGYLQRYRALWQGAEGGPG